MTLTATGQIEKNEYKKNRKNHSLLRLLNSLREKEIHFFFITRKPELDSDFKMREKKEIELGIVIEDDRILKIFLQILDFNDENFITNGDEIYWWSGDVSCRIHIYRCEGKFLFSVFNEVMKFEDPYPKNPIRKFMDICESKPWCQSVIKKRNTGAMTSSNFLSSPKAQKQEFLVNFIDRGDIKRAEKEGELELLLSSGGGILFNSLNNEYDIEHFILELDERNLVKYSMNLNDVAYCLKVISRAFEALNLEIYLSAGTLLGAIRNGKIIPWDYDVDLASRETHEENMKAISELLVADGMSVYYSRPWSVIGVFYNGISFDIDFFRDSGDKLTAPYIGISHAMGKIFYYVDWIVSFNVASPTRLNLKNGVRMAILRDFLILSCQYVFGERRKFIGDLMDYFARKTNNIRGSIVIPKRCVGNYVFVEFMGQRWRIPEFYEEYLSLYYGDWRVEKKKFSYVGKDSKPVSGVLFSDIEWEKRL